MALRAADWGNGLPHQVAAGPSKRSKIYLGWVCMALGGLGGVKALDVDLFFSLKLCQSLAKAGQNQHPSMAGVCDLFFCHLGRMWRVNASWLMCLESQRRKRQTRTQRLRWMTAVATRRQIYCRQALHHYMGTCREKYIWTETLSHTLTSTSTVCFFFFLSS